MTRPPLTLFLKEIFLKSILQVNQSKEKERGYRVDLEQPIVPEPVTV